MDDGERIALPDNISEAELVEIVRELLGDDDMTDHDLLEAFRSGMFQELCPDIEQYQEERRKTKQNNELAKNNKSESSKPKSKDEPKSSGDERRKTKQKTESQQQQQSVKLKIKEEPKTSKDVDRAKTNHKSESINKHEKPKVKVKTEPRSSSDERGRSREKIHVQKKDVPKPKHSSSSDRSRDRSRKKEKKKKKVKRIVKYISSSSRSSSSRSPTPERKKEPSHSKNYVDKPPEKKDSNRAPKHKSGSVSDSSGGKPSKKKKRSKSSSQRIRSSSSDCSRGKTPERKKEVTTHSKLNGNILEPSRDAMKKESALQSKSNDAGGESSRENQAEKEKKEPKPFSKYSATSANINLNTWKPSLHREHLRYQRKYKLKPLSVVCVDMQDVPLIFHNPRDSNPKPNSVPLKPHVTVSSTRMEMFKRLERDKASAFKKKLNRKAAKFMKRHRYEESSNRRGKMLDRIVSSTSSNSDSSSIMIPSRKPGKIINDNHKGRGRCKMSKSEREAEARRRKIEEVKKKANEAYTARGTRVLPWENKKDYFKGKKKEEAAKKEKEKIVAEKRRKQEQLRKERLERQKNAPTVSFQKILATIDAANKAAATVPKVELKIPKLSHNLPPRVYKPDGKITLGDVAKEVTRLLSSDVKVECPVIPDEMGDFGEYTVRKIAWWFLKNEKTPAEQGLFHPELRDNEGLESEHEDDYDWPSDMSSIHGCVSDPEGVYGELPPDPKKVNDADWADDYCGNATLYAKFRKLKDLEGDERHEPITLKQAESDEDFKLFVKTEKFTNYEKPNFKARCFICKYVIVGQRQLGAHIRSDSHKDNFRNYSLKFATYDEKMTLPAPKKEFVAKLVEYSVNATDSSNPGKSDVVEQMRHRVAKIEPVRSDSPGPIIDGMANPTNGAVEIAEMPLPDNISLPSVQDYDISSDESLMNVKVVMRTEGKWNDTLEKSWRAWQDEEAKIAEQYNELREFYIVEPQKHKKYDQEWLAFWERRNNELEAEGVDTDQHNFQKEWLPFWLTRVQEIMKDDVEVEVKNLKRRYGIDKETLRARYRISAEDTRRKNKKKKKYKTQNVSSSIKSLKKSAITEGEISQTSELRKRETQREEQEYLERKRQREREFQGGSVNRDKKLEERNNQREKQMQERKRLREAKDLENPFEIDLTGAEPPRTVETQSFEAGLFEQRVTTAKQGEQEPPEARKQQDKADQLQKDSRWDKREWKDNRSKDYHKEKKDYYERKDHHRKRDKNDHRHGHHGRKDSNHKDRRDHYRDKKDHYDRKHHKERTDEKRPNQTERRSSYEQGNSRDSGNQLPQPQPVVAPTQKYVYNSNIDDAVANVSEESVCLPTPPGTSDVVTSQQRSRSASFESGKRAAENHILVSKPTIGLPPTIPEVGLDDISPTNSVTVDINCDSKNNGVSKTIDMENVSCTSSLESGEVASDVSLNRKAQNITTSRPPPVPPVISERRPSTSMESAYRIQTYISR